MIISGLSDEDMNKWLLWNTKLPEKVNESFDLAIASCHSVSAQKAALNFSNNSELLIVNVEGEDISRVLGESE